MSAQFQVLTTEQLIALFDATFLASCNTRLMGGADEPIYLPADYDEPHHRLFFREDYLSSAFHEIAHWCIAGEARRQLVDFGYWYQPDGRTVEQQTEFEQVEVKPQAVEWHLSVAAGHKFHLSADNLNGDCGASDAFANAVCEQAQAYGNNGLPPRAQQLVTVLSERLGTDTAYQAESFDRERL